MLTTSLLVLCSLATGLLFFRTIWALRRFTYRSKVAAPTNIPSVSVCIAARNESHALAQCLENVLKSDYPKLEILVLDDSSNDDTSLIIKSFAGAGVRFIAGSELPAGWLGKNHAYQTLINEASGDVITFLDVDTLVSVTSISQLVGQMQVNQKSMLSVLPRREDGYHASAVFGTLRYFWELLLASRKSPPASSALWMVESKKLHAAGVGLTNYGLSVRPERHLARQLQKNKDYYYVIGTPKLGVRYEKRIASQRETALRLYYPMTGRKLLSGLSAIGFMVLLAAPLAIFSYRLDVPYLAVWSAALLIIVTMAFGLFTHRTFSATWWIVRTIVWPVLLIQEVLLLSESYVRYRRGTLTWKGRALKDQPLHHDALKINE